MPYHASASLNPRPSLLARWNAWCQQLAQTWGMTDQTQALELRVQLHGQALRARLSAAAVQAAERLASPLTVEMELYFSCLVRKSVRFYATTPNLELPVAAQVRLLPQLLLRFHPVSTQQCSMADTRLDTRLDTGAKPPVETLPVVKPQAFVPRWIDIDFHDGEWVGENGY